MGLFPCTMCAKRFRGKALHVYPAMLNGHGAERAHHRLCNECYDAFTENLGKYGTLMGAQDQVLPRELNCLQCGELAASDDALIMVTLYSGEDERHDWAGAAHKGDCAAALVGLWSLCA